MPEPDPPAKEPESLERQFVRWVYRDPKYPQLPHRPARLEPRRRRPNLAPMDRWLLALTNVGCEWRPSLTDVDSWQAECPAHEDTRPSLQLTRNADGTVYFRCWAGCSKEAILARLGLEWRDCWDGSHHDHGRADTYRPFLPHHLRRAMLDLLDR